MQLERRPHHVERAQARTAGLIPGCSECWDARKTFTKSSERQTFRHLFKDARVMPRPSNVTTRPRMMAASAVICFSLYSALKTPSPPCSGQLIILVSLQTLFKVVGRDNTSEGRVQGQVNLGKPRRSTSLLCERGIAPFSRASPGRRWLSACPPTRGGPRQRRGPTTPRPATSGFRVKSDASPGSWSVSGVGVSDGGRSCSITWTQSCSSVGSVAMNSPRCSGSHATR